MVTGKKKKTFRGKKIEYMGSTHLQDPISQKMKVLAQFYDPLLILYGHQDFAPPPWIKIKKHMYIDNILIDSISNFQIQYFAKVKPKN